MAASIALRWTVAEASNGLWPRLTGQLRSTCVAPSVTRSFNTSTQMRRYDDGDDPMGNAGVDRHRGERPVPPRSSSFFSDEFEPFSTSRSLSQVLNLMDQLTDNPFLASSQGIGSGTRLGWDVKEDADALHLRMDMPGLGKEHVKVSVQENTLSIKGEGEKESGGEDASSARRYSSRIELPPTLFRLGEIKAEMKNGVLRVVVPKVRKEERKDVFHVKIE